MIKHSLVAASLLLALVLTGCRTPRPGPETQPAHARPIAAADNELHKLVAASETAQAEVEKLLEENRKRVKEGAGLPGSELNKLIEARLAPIRRGYEKFFRRHPKYADARVAYGSFLGDQCDEDAAREQFEVALALDTNNPAIYNNLANIYGHTGSIKKAFEFYAKAIELDSTEPVYYHNFGTTVYLFRTDAKEFYGINEQQVFDKALMLYSNSMRLDPTNFDLASDVALSYYAIKPWRFEAALQSWTNALSLAHTAVEREGVFIHFARVKTQAGRYEEARADLAIVTNEHYATLKNRLLRNIEERRAKPPDTTSQPASSR